MDEGGFDIQALYAALDARRRSRDMAWRQVALEVRGNRRRGLRASTLLRTKQAQRLEADGMLQMVRWLGRTPESFAGGGHEAGANAAMTIARVTAPGIPRFDTKALFAALDLQRSSRRMTWPQVALEIGVSAPSLTRMAKGGRTGVHQMLRTVRWLGRTVESFTRLSER